jgi:hypothetical protein
MRRPHVLIAAMPGGTAVRLAAEQQLRQRGWPAALTPADADVLFVAGSPTEQHVDVVNRVWRAMPAPRARATATDPAQVAEVLEAAVGVLADTAGQRRICHVGESDEDLPMADRGDDRDGLKLDQLHVTLGPVLPDWPAGLVVRVTLQGDVVQQAAVDATFASAAGGGSYWTEPWRRALAGEPVTRTELARRRVAAHLDSLGRLLAVAGWDDAAVTGRRLRDETLAGAAAEVLRPAVGRFARRVERSRLLAWSTRGLGLLTADDAIAAGVGGPALRGAGDVTARYRRWCREVR